jgi:sterol desaturase/sphingolipid hydroxylase (fatty acid hydroxylase superfamily)
VVTFLTSAALGHNVVATIALVVLLAAARMHPADDMIGNTLVGLVLYVAGFSVQIIFMIGPIPFLHIALIHANVTWDFGPLRKVFVSPAHHRAHHEVGDFKNCAGMFSFTM